MTAGIGGTVEGVSAVVDRRYNRLAKPKTTELYELDA
jgi:hypothetical protein